MPEGVFVEAVLPDMPLKYEGPAGAEFATPALLRKPEGTAVRMPSWPRTPGTCWIMVNGTSPWVGFCIAPLGTATGQEREATLRAIF